MRGTNKRFLAEYVSKKMRGRVKNVSEQELEQFFNERGWKLFDLETMISNFKAWRAERTTS